MVSMSKSYKMKNELRSASEVTLTNYMTGSGGGGYDTPPGDDVSSTSTVDVVGLTNFANSDLNLTNRNKGVLVSNNTDGILFSHNNNHTHHPLHQLHHLHHHLHRPYDRTSSWTTVNGHSALSKYKYILFVKVHGA